MGSCEDLNIWAKKKGEFRHPLLYHLLDTVFVTEQIWDNCLQMQVQNTLLGIFTGQNLSNTRKFICFFAGLHDLGKLSPEFQREKTNRTPHNHITTKLFDALFPNNPFCKRLGQVLGGHHGTFPSSHELIRIHDLSQNTIQQAGNITVIIASTLGISKSWSEQVKLVELNNSSAIVLAGLVSVADWIASNEEYFPYDNQSNLDGYIVKSRQNASKAIKQLKWDGWHPANMTLSFDNLFPDKIPPRPLQTMASDLCGKLSCIRHFV